MPKQELLGEVKKLINLGKEKGFLTYDDLNSTFRRMSSRRTNSVRS